LRERAGNAEPLPKTKISNLGETGATIDLKNRKDGFGKNAANRNYKGKAVTGKRGDETAEKDCAHRGEATHLETPWEDRGEQTSGWGGEGRLPLKKEGNGLYSPGQLSETAEKTVEAHLGGRVRETDHEETRLEK